MQRPTGSQHTLVIHTVGTAGLVAAHALDKKWAADSLYIRPGMQVPVQQ